ncbi:shikimate dehydrogenase [Halorhodospira abdelmalekii]|uniref:shikimate dehydrogenase n=1 Tax=Halorhodospira abdelmalekii TaxID=421629 RepID=UPI001906F92F|nr:shikimate dehydrogenase [Halorhodospira abdelmalekii]MBK1733981.1 shikimate dehydrogenase [Halorhodospira abdelmalekii]
MTDCYAVIGNPIEHSKSPEIHRRFAAATGEAMTYRRLWAPHEHFRAVAEAFCCGGGHGLNVTVPFKEEAYAFADRLSERAAAAGAVNTLRFDSDGQRFGDNTDGVGLLRDLQDNLGITIAGRRVLVLGAGGAARGVLPALLAADPAALFLANRTAARAEALAERFGTLHPCPLSAIPERGFELIVNTTAAGLQGENLELPDDVLAPGGTAYDLVYADTETPFIRWARTHGATTTSDGLGMLVEQAAEAFFVWRGVRPPTAPVIAALRRGEA